MVIVDKLLIIRELLNLVVEFRASARPHKFEVAFKATGSRSSPALTARLIGPAYTVAVFVDLEHREWTVWVTDKTNAAYSVGIIRTHFVNPSTLYDLTLPLNWKGRGGI